MRKMSEAELAACNGLIAGDLEPLADVLDTEVGELHPILQRWLLKLIRGSSDETDFRLVAMRHPDLKRASDGPRAKRLASMAKLDTAIEMVRNGALNEGQWEAAMLATIENTGLARSTIAGHWSDRKRFLLFCRARGLLQG